MVRWPLPSPVPCVWMTMAGRETSLTIPLGKGLQLPVTYCCEATPRRGPSSNSLIVPSCSVGHECGWEIALLQVALARPLGVVPLHSYVCFGREGWRRLGLLAGHPVSLSGLGKAGGGLTWQLREALSQATGSGSCWVLFLKTSRQYNLFSVCTVL